MRNLAKIIGHKNATALRACCRFADPQLIFVLLHFFFQVNKLVWQNERFGNEREVFSSMKFLKFRDLSVHQIFSSNVKTTREVIYLLVPRKTFINIFLDRSDCPVYSPLAFIYFIVFSSFDVSESIVFQSKSDDLNVVLVEVKVITPIWCWVGSD